MRIHFPKSQAASPGPLMFALILVFSINAPAQTSGAKAKTNATTKSSLEKKFFVNILKDQRAIWTSPFHLQGNDAKWLAPLGFSTIALLATDRRTSSELVENGDNLSRLRISRHVSQLGSIYATAGVAGVFYLTGRASHNNHLTETGLLSAEALIDSGILVIALKTASQRPRPAIDDSSGEFFDGGNSFPSGHASSAWSVATIIAQEYGHHRPLVKIGAYGLASAVSLSRYTGRNHFLSEILVGSAIGYATGRYVYHKHHDVALDAENEKENDNVAHSKLFPRIVPLYYPRAHVYGGMMTWSF